MEFYLSFIFYFVIRIATVLSQESIYPSSVSVSVPGNYKLVLGSIRQIRASVNIVSTQTSKRITGPELWKVSAWMSTTQDGSDVIGFHDQILNANLKRKPAIENKALPLSGVYQPPDVDDCSVRYFCARFGAADGGSVNVEGRPNDSVLTSCTEVACQDSRQCRVNGQTYAVGATWEGSDCTTCVCQPNQQPSCSKVCPTVEPDCDVTVQDDGECCARCAKSCDVDGVVRVPLEVWKNERCESCTCDDGTVSCGGPSCVPLGCDVSQQVTDAGECCPRCAKECNDFTVTPRSSGESWQADACTNCQCIDGDSQCTTVDCPVLSCDISQAITEPDQCCPRCPKECNNFTVTPRSPGESWQVDACTNCQCIDGESQCTTVDCPFLSCDISQAITEPGQCCPRCPEACTYRFSRYDHGATWDENECTHCECNDGSPRCITDQCRPLGCTNPIKIPGQCCATCLTDTCFHNGETYNNGQTWSSDDGEGPQTCRCIQGGISCVLQKAATSGDCLLENNELRRHKEAWNINCTRCLCRGGKVRCFPHPSRPSCGDCVVRGRHVQFGDTYWQHEGGSCRRCVCGGSCAPGDQSCPNMWQISGIQVLDTTLTLDEGNLVLREGSDTNKIAFNLNVNIDTSDPYGSSSVSGNSLWQVKAWFSSNRDGSGPKNALRRQVLSKARASSPYSGESALQFETRRRFKTNGYSCAELRFFCARFKASGKALPSYGEKLVINNNNEKDRLTSCMKVKGCK